MKNILKYTSIVFITSVIFSCTDLNETPYTFIDPSSFYKNETQLEEALNSVYTQFRNVCGSYDYYMKLECYTDMAQPSYTKENCPNINSWYDVNNASASYTFSNTWKRAYACINRANTVLGRGEGMDIDEATKSKIFAQARFLRAYCYYILVRLYGGVPIPESFTEGLNGLEIPRKSVDDVYNYILTDLTYCEENLPIRGSDNYDVWRVSKGAAQSLFSELYLYRASMEGNTEYYNKCKEYCEKVINSNIYSLVPNYKNLWYFFNKDAKNNNESIFELQFSAISGQADWCHKMFGLGNSITVPGFGSMFYHRCGPSHYAYSSYDDTDLRKQVLITNYTYNGSERQFLLSDKGFFPGKQGWLTACPGNSKYYDPWTDASLEQPSADLYMLRYSEILLNEAEALNQLETTDSHGRNALYYLNLVHQRAGLNALGINSKQDLDDAIFQERCWEFIGEGKIYFDELRTNRLGDRVASFVKKGVADGLYQFKDLNFKPKKTFLWKIPQGDLDSNPELEQNPDNVSDSF